MSSGKVTSLDGQVAAGCGDSVVTTPNQDIIWEPHFGTRNVHLQADLRYGVDDPLNWPQPYTGGYPYLAAIRHKPQDADDPLAMMWWEPLASDFVPLATSLVSRLGQLCRP